MALQLKWHVRAQHSILSTYDFKTPLQGLIGLYTYELQADLSINLSIIELPVGAEYVNYLSLSLQTSYFSHQSVECVVNEVTQSCRRLEEWTTELSGQCIALFCCHLSTLLYLVFLNKLVNWYGKTRRLKEFFKSSKIVIRLITLAVLCVASSTLSYKKNIV